MLVPDVLICKLKYLLLVNLFFLFQTLPEVCSEQDELDFLMEALIIRCVWMTWRLAKPNKIKKKGSSQMVSS